jgi:kinesin family member 6/9
MPSRQGKVKVYVRTRPTQDFANDMIEFGGDERSINIYSKKAQNQGGYVNNQITDWSFRVDGILNNVTQEEVYDNVVKDISLSVLNGYNGTVLCYGQTGAGKTFTMTGVTENFSQRGIIPRTIQHIFKEIQNRPDQTFTVRIGYLEIYNEQLFDLLSTLPAENTSSQMSIIDNRGDMFVKGLTYMIANNEEDALNLLFEVR